MPGYTHNELDPDQLTPFESAVVMALAKNSPAPPGIVESCLNTNDRAANAVGGGAQQDETRAVSRQTIRTFRQVPAPDCTKFGKEYDDGLTWGDVGLYGVLVSACAFWLWLALSFLDWAQI